MKKDGDMIWKWIAMGADKHETSVGNKRSDYSVWDLHRCALVIVSSRKHEIVRDDKRVFAESEAHGTRRCSTVADEAVTQIGESKWCRSINTNPWDTGRDKYF